MITICEICVICGQQSDSSFARFRSEAEKEISKSDSSFARFRNEMEKEIIMVRVIRGRKKRPAPVSRQMPAALTM